MHSSTPTLRPNPAPQNSKLQSASLNISPICIQQIYPRLTFHLYGFISRYSREGRHQNAVQTNLTGTAGYPEIIPIRTILVALQGMIDALSLTLHEPICISNHGWGCQSHGGHDTDGERSEEVGKLHDYDGLLEVSVKKYNSELLASDR